MNPWEIVFDVVVGILVVMVAGLAIFSVALSYREERLAKKEQRERSRIRAAEGAKDPAAAGD